MAAQQYGVHAHHTWFGSWGGFEMENTVGLQLRYDDIGSVGLFNFAACSGGAARGNMRRLRPGSEEIIRRISDKHV